MNSEESLVRNQIVSIIDQLGCPCTGKQFIQFVQQAKQLNARKIGKMTYVLCDVEFDPQSYGQVEHQVVVMNLDSTMSITPLCAYLIDQHNERDSSATAA